jgi:hypothetical protein
LEQRVVERRVLIGDFERGPGTVDGGDLLAGLRQVKGKASLIAENIERGAVGVLRAGGVVLALVEEGSGLLAFAGVEVNWMPFTVKMVEVFSP